MSKTGIAFADDLHFAWTIRTGAALEEAYQGVKAVLIHPEAHKLQVSVDKTVLISELRGPKAAAVLKKYVVEKAQGSFMRFRINQKDVDIKIVTQHVYLGVRISYRKFEQETVKRRMRLAQAQQTSLPAILKCQAVAMPGLTLSPVICPTSVGRHCRVPRLLVSPCLSLSPLVSLLYIPVRGSPLPGSWALGLPVSRCIYPCLWVAIARFLGSLSRVVSL